MNDSAGGERIVAGDLRQMPRVVDGENANVAAPAKFKAIDAAVGSDEPGSLFCFGMYRAENIKRQETNRSGMRENRDAPASVSFENLVQNVCRAIK